MQNLIRLNLIPKEREKLKKQFQKLKTIDEQLDFWNEKLKIDFCYFDQCLGEEIEDFWIRPKNESEFEFVNTRNLNYYKSRLELGQGKSRFQDFEELKESFLKKLETIKNKDYFIENELLKLKSFVTQKETEASQNPIAKSRFFMVSYKQYFENESEPILNKQIYETGNMLESDFGLSMAKYKEFIENYRTQSATTPPKYPKFTHDQQMFILDYFGFYDVPDKSLKGFLWGAVMNRDPETTRQRFSTIESRKTVKNLEMILSYFTELGFEEQIQLIKKDIVKVESRKNGKNRLKL